MKVIFLPKKLNFYKKSFSWHEFFNPPSEHYGWVVEINPKNHEIRKLVALGRFRHEGASVVKANNNIPVVYMGEDKVGGHIYKFISDKENSFKTGKLFVADIKAGKWLHLSKKNNPKLNYFSSNLEVLTYASVASDLINATKCDRPEDIAINPINKDVFVSLTNNIRAGNLYGSILKIVEKNSNPLAMEFTASTYINGGTSSGIACPDNLLFDTSENLWMTSDMSIDSTHGKAIYNKFNNNGLFFIPTNGKLAGEAFQIASAPKGAELTGISFTPDYKNLLICIQHPKKWPNNASNGPSLVSIYGKELDSLTKYNS